MIKLTGLLLILSVALTLYTFIDCARRDETQIQKLPKWGWLIIILLTGVFGPIAYLVIGRNPLKNLPISRYGHLPSFTPIHICIYGSSHRAGILYS